jgi:hypothetical protein
LIIRRADDTIPKAFALPLDVREYFEGVRTGDEGEYEEVSLPRTQNNVVKMNRAGFIEEPNYKETRDNKGNLIRCYRCGMTSNGRDIIPCDYCPARWHLDCLDPPLAAPPRRRGNDKSFWRCPLHVEHDLAGLGRQAEAAPGDLGRIPRYRKPKSAVPLDVPVRRGFRNNGIIEVDLTKTHEVDPDKTKEFYMAGKVHRVPEEGIRLDFIDRVKKSWYEDQSFPRQMDAPKRIRGHLYRPDNVVLHHPPEHTVVEVRESDFWTSATALAIAETAKANAALRNRSIKEQQTVLNLVEMSQQAPVDHYSGDALAELTNRLVSEAPPEVVTGLERTEVDQLVLLRDLINKRLSILGQEAPYPSVEEQEDQVASPSPRRNGNHAKSPSLDSMASDVRLKKINGEAATFDGDDKNDHDHSPGRWDY